MWAKPRGSKLRAFNYLQLCSAELKTNTPKTPVDKIKNSDRCFSFLPCKWGISRNTGKAYVDHEVFIFPFYAAWLSEIKRIFTTIISYKNKFRNNLNKLDLYLRPFCERNDLVGSLWWMSACTVGLKLSWPDDMAERLGGLTVPVARSALNTTARASGAHAELLRIAGRI